MTQFARPTLNAAVDDGITLSQKNNGAWPALYTNHAGAAAPPSPEKGQMWVDTSLEAAATPTLALRQFTGTVWREIGVLNLTTGLFTTAGGLPLTGGTVTGPILFPSGTALLPGMAFAGNANTGIWRIGANNLGFSTGGVNRISLTGVDMDISIAHMRLLNANPNFAMNRDTGAGTSTLRFQVGASNRWQWQMIGAESTGNAGSNMNFQMMDDAGNLIVSFLQFTRDRRLGINGPSVGPAPLNVRTNAVIAAEDALDLMNTFTGADSNVGLNFRTGSGAMRGAIRGERPGGANTGDIGIWTARTPTSTPGALVKAATFRANGDLWVSGVARVDGGFTNDAIGGSVITAAGMGVNVGGYFSFTGGYGCNLALGDPAHGSGGGGVQIIHITGQTFQTRLFAATVNYDFRSDGNGIRGFDNAFIPWQQQSDIRIKENVAPSKVDALAVLTKINTVEFDFIQKDGSVIPVSDRHCSVGFIAQQVQEHAPEVIRVMNGEFHPAGGDKAHLDLHSVDNAALVPYLVKALQQQQEIIQDLESRLKKLETRK